MKRQKKIRNVSYKDVIDLDITVAKFILPRLKFFKKKVLCYPSELSMEEWKAIIDKMILSFSLILDDSEPNFTNYKCNLDSLKANLSNVDEEGSIIIEDDAYYKWHKEKEAKINEGLQLFAKYFQHLWL